MDAMSTPRSLGRKLLVVLGLAVGLAVLIVALLLVVVNSGVATKRAVDLVLPSVSKALGREVTLREAKLKLFPATRVTLAGLTVAGRPGEPALVETESLDVEVALWPLLRSLGKDVEVRSFTVVRPSLNLVKAKDGTWNFEGLGGGGPAKEPAPPAPPPAEGGGARFAVDLVKIDRAAIRVIDRTLGSDVAALALTMLDLEARGVGPGLPLDARLAAALADTRQNLHAQLSVAKLPAGIVRGGTASVDAKLSTARGAYRVDGTGELKDVRLRGQSSSGRFRAAAVWSPAKPDAARLDVTDLALRGPGIDLGGNVSVETAPMRAWFVLTGPLLDLDAVMGILPEGTEPAKEKPPAKEKAPTAEGELVPEATRRQIQAASARGTIAVEKLKGGRLEATDVKAKATLSRGTLTLDEMTASVFGGRVSASGTKVSLTEKVPAWKLVASLSGLDLEKALAAFAGRAPLLGKVDGRLDIEGKGLSALGRGSAAKKVGGVAGGKTTFKDLAGKFTVKDGFLAAQSPLRFGASAGEVALGGRIGLDGRLDLQGTTVVPKKVLAEI